MHNSADSRNEVVMSDRDIHLSVLIVNDLCLAASVHCHRLTVQIPCNSNANNNVNYICYSQCTVLVIFAVTHCKK